MKCFSILRNAMTLSVIVVIFGALANSQVRRPQEQTITPIGALKPRWVPSKPDKIILDPKQAAAGVFVLKFVEGSHVRLGPNGLYLDQNAIVNNQNELKRLARFGLNSERAASQLAQVKTLLSEYEAKAGFKVNPLFQLKTKNPGDRFAEKSKLEQVGGEELADMDLYYVVHAPGLKEMDIQVELMNQLKDLAIVEQVHPDVLSSGAHTVQNVTHLQTYLNPAPSGVDGWYIWSRTGGSGENVRFIDVEYDWVTDHEDFPPLSNQFWGGRPACAYDGNNTEHGTAVMGIVAARANSLGVTGFAPNVRFGLSSVCRPFDYLAAGTTATFSGENFVGRAHSIVVANAILAASSALQAGDILLIEQHSAGPGPDAGLTCTCNCRDWGYVPVEFYQESFDAIRRATIAGIVVIEAAANGGQNLDGPLYGGRFNRAIRDSEAILVGASGAGDGKIVCFSSSSQRIDLYAWGTGVTTLGYGDGSGAGVPFSNSDIPRRYKQSFGGTSSASAIVAGAAISLQSARVSAGFSRLTPNLMRSLLRSTGTPQQDTGVVITARPIGAQPDLRAAFQRSILPALFNTTMLIGLDLAGADYRSFGTLNDRGLQCANTCGGERACQAWTWVRPGVQEPSARCWLKHTVPTATNNSDTNSGISGIREGQDLPGGDFSDFATANDRGGQCLATCLRDSTCKAWTWVQPGAPGLAARCWLKNTVPSFSPTPNTISSVVRP